MRCPTELLEVVQHGRFVFESDASNLVPGDTNHDIDVFVRGRVVGTTERVSVTSGGAQAANAQSWFAAISANGRFISFSSPAPNLVFGDTNHWSDVFVRDRVAGTTERVSVASGGVQVDGASGPWSAISADGRFVAFLPNSNLAAADTNRWPHVFLRDRVASITRLISVGRGPPARFGQAVLHPSPPRAGRQLTVTAPLRAGGTVAHESAGCSATLAGHHLAATSVSFHAGRARCVWQIQKTAHGKQLKGSLVGTTDTGRATRSFAARVR